MVALDLFSRDAEPGSGLGRQRLLLDGEWDFRLEGDETWRVAHVPSPWQAEFDDLRHASGTAIYVKRFVLPRGWAGRQLAICFGAVNYSCTVALNGTEIAEHEGGYLPFEAVLPATALRDGENRLQVRVTLPNSDADRYPEFPFPEIPHGKQSWYGRYGGIWQSVHLEARDASHVQSCRIAPDLRTGRVGLDLLLSAAPSGAEVRIRITDPRSRVAAERTTEAAGRAIRLAFEVREPLPWSPEAPNLYELEIALAIGGKELDRWRSTFGFRTIEARDGKLFLNGGPLYLRGALDQDYYPDGICTPPSLDFLEDQLRKAKELGLNCLRCHIKVPDPRYYEVADRLGMLIWTEIPNFAFFTERAEQRLRETMQGILERDGNHPSIVIWTIINEDWGTELTEDPDHRRWLAETYDWLKRLDPTRLVVDNSPCIPNYHVTTDLNDYHYYRCVPERRIEWDALTEEFAGGAAWTFTPHDDAQRRGDEPLIVSEFGVWGLPRPQKLLEANGREPWWFETGQGWGDGSAYPHGSEQRFEAFHLDSVFASFEAYIDALQWHQFRNLKYQIETMRARASIVGYVITELTDVHWEANGLLDMRRNPRIFHDRFAEVNSDIVIAPLVGRWAHWCGEPVELGARIAAGGSSVPGGSKLVWRLDDARSGDGRVDGVAALATGPTLPIRFQATDDGGNRTARLELLLEDPSGATLARNEVELSFYRKPERAGRPSVWSPDAKVMERLAALGYEASSRERADVALVRSIDPADVEAVRLGGRYLILAEGDEVRDSEAGLYNAAQPRRMTPAGMSLRSDPPPREPPFIAAFDETPGIPVQRHHRFPGLGLVSRHNTIWRGDWIASFGWLRRKGAFARLPGGPLLDLSFDRVIPHFVLTGLRLWEYEARVHSGVTVGWVHKPAAYVVEKPFGRGKVVASAFRLFNDDPGVDPVATVLLDALIECAAAPAATGGREPAGGAAGSERAGPG